MSQAIIVTIGSELTDGRVTDTNSAWLAQDLSRLGLSVALTLSVPDDAAAIGQVLTLALARRPQLLLVSGGLGPTEDDLTAAAIAQRLGLLLETNPRAAELMRLALGEEQLQPYQLKQARLPAGSLPLTPVGTAPGFLLRAADSVLVVLPGVPWELKVMWQEAKASAAMAPILAAAQPSYRRRLFFYEAGEPQVGQAVEQFQAESGAQLEISICARYREVKLEAAAPLASSVQVDGLIDVLKQRFAGQIYSEGEEIEAVIAAELVARGQSLAVGESCTGGLLGAAITDLSGSSNFFRGGVIAYDNQVKRELLKVRQEILDTLGAVSEPVAQQLALGVRALLKADYGIGITGIAGPAGGTEDKPVGLVYICVSSEAGDLVRGFYFPGGRGDVRRAAVTAALQMLAQKLQRDAAEI